MLPRARAEGQAARAGRRTRAEREARAGAGFGGLLRMG